MRGRGDEVVGRALLAVPCRILHRQSRLAVPLVRVGCVWKGGARFHDWDGS